MFADWRFIVITGGAVSGGREALATATIARKSMAIAESEKPKVASVLGKTRQNAPAGGYRDIDSGRNRSVAKRAAQIAGLL
jgi:hypothetical protein